MSANNQPYSEAQKAMIEKFNAHIREGSSSFAAPTGLAGVEIPTAYWVCKVCTWAQRVLISEVSVKHHLWNKKQGKFCPGVPAVAKEPNEK